MRRTLRACVCAKHIARDYANLLSPGFVAHKSIDLAKRVHTHTHTHDKRSDVTRSRRALTARTTHRPPAYTAQSVASGARRAHARTHIYLHHNDNSAHDISAAAASRVSARAAKSRCAIARAPEAACIELARGALSTRRRRQDASAHAHALRSTILSAGHTIIRHARAHTCIYTCAIYPRC